MNPKQRAGEKATEYIKDGMVVGLGTGSTAYYAIKRIGELVKEGLEIIGIPTSSQTEKIAKEFGVKLSTLNEHPVVDLTIDGADEVDPNLNLIKGMGGALLREKIVAVNSKMEIIVADYTKVVTMLGTRSPLPVEVLPFSWKVSSQHLSELNCKVELRFSEGRPFITDNGNFILDCKFEKIEEPYQLEKDINAIPGVIENGLFPNIADKAVIGYDDRAETIEKN